MAPDTDTSAEDCVGAALRAVVALIVALDACDVLDPFAAQLREDLIVLREDLEEETD